MHASAATTATPTLARLVMLRRRRSTPRSRFTSRRPLRSIDRVILAPFRCAGGERGWLSGDSLSGVLPLSRRYDRSGRRDNHGNLWCCLAEGARELGARSHAELAVDSRQVPLDRVGAEMQRLGDLAVRATV